jgi:hypothetical protein
MKTHKSSTRGIPILTGHYSFGFFVPFMGVKKITTTTIRTFYFGFVFT